VAVTGIPGHDELAPMAAGMIQAALSGDSPTMGTIAREIKHMGMTPDEVAITFAAIAGRMLAGTSGGRQSADFVTRSVVARRAGMLAP
jgi:hypothetical protein